MPRDLTQWLHDTAVEPSQPVDPGGLVAQGRRRRRLRRGGLAAGSVIAAVLAGALVLGPLTAPRQTEIIIQPPTPAEPEDEPDAEDGAAFVPPTTADGDRRLLPLRFPGGTTAEIAYPDAWELHERGVTPGAVVSIADEQDEAAGGYGQARTGRYLEVHPGPLDDVLRRLNDGRDPEVVAEYEGPDAEPVRLYALTAGDYLAWQAGGWAVLLADTVGDGPPLGDEDRGLYAAHLRLVEDADGWLVARADAPLRVEQPYVVLGDPEAAVEYARNPAPLPQEDPGPDRVLVHASACAWTGVGQEPGLASWCDLDTQLSFDVVGSDDFVQRVADGLEARTADYPVSMIDPAWVTEDERQAWQAEHGEGTWVVGYFYPPAFDFVDYEQFTEVLEPRWRRIADDDLGLDREGELREALAALTGPPPPRLSHGWQGRRLELTTARLEDSELVLDFAVLLAAGQGTTGGAAMGAQFDAVVSHYYPEVDSVCVLLDGEPSSWLHDAETCPSRTMS